MMNNKEKRCVVCNGTSFGFMYSVIDTNQGVPGKWDILVCEDCGTGILNPFPDTQEISSFYRDHFYTQDGNRFRGWMEIMRGFFGRLRSRMLNQLCPARGRLLDFGSGAGHFAAAQSRLGWDVHALDPYSPVSTGSDSCRLTEEGFELLYEDESFDAITLWYVIEHLYDPRSALGEFRRVLKPGGVLVLAQQDFGSVQAKVFANKWLYLDPPRHLWQFTSDSLQLLTRKEGFECKKVRYSSLEMSPFCMLQSTLNVIIGNENDLFRFLKNRKLPKEVKDKASGNIRPLATIFSVLLLPILTPLVLVFYLLLLLFKQGDIFTLYLVKKND